MRGEAGNDTIYAGPRSEDKFTWNSGGNPIDMGGSGYDRLIMNAGAQFKTKDLSSYGFEEFRGAEKDDSVWTSKNSTTGVYLDGGSGNDDLRGGRGPDELRGSHGSDILYGRGGRDDLRGQGGRDQFNFKNDYGRDVIWDFQNNLDTIRLDDDLRGLRDGNHSYNLGKVGDLARRSGNDLILDFGEDELVIKNTTWAAVIDDIVFSS